MNNLYIEAAREALEVSLAEDIPNDLKTVTYETVLKHKLEILSGGESTIDPLPKEENVGYQDFKKWEKEIIKDLPRAAVAADGNRSQQTIWAIITLYGRDESANTETIRRVIKEELGNTPQSSKNTSAKLGELFPTYLSRTKDGKKYNYAPNKDALKVFRNE